MTEQDARRHIYLTPVHAERADEFEEFLRSTLMPAVRKTHPEMGPRSQTLRAERPEEDGIVYFTFILDGGDASEWEIERLLREALGDELGLRESQRLDEMIRGEQIGATFRAVDM